MYTFPCPLLPGLQLWSRAGCLPFTQNSVEGSFLSGPHLKAHGLHTCPHPGAQFAQIVCNLIGAPGLCNLVTFLYSSFCFPFFLMVFFFFRFGLFTVDCVLQASNPTPLYLSPHLWLPLQLPAPSHLFLFITPDSCHLSYASIFC